MCKDDELKIELKPGVSGRMRLFAKQGEKTIHADNVDPVSDMSRQRFFKKLLQKVPALTEEDSTRLEEDIIQRSWKLVSTNKQGQETCAGQPDTDKLLAEMSSEARHKADEMLQDPSLIGQVIEDIAALGIAGEHELTATLYLVGTSRLLDRPLAAIVQGHTSSGKSYILQRVASLFPEETVIRATQMTPQALYHMPADRLIHRFVVAGERARVQNDENADATKSLREMISEGWLIKQVCEKLDGRFQTVEKKVAGPIAYVESTALSNIFEEDANRCLMLNTDETSPQTRRVLETIASAYSGDMENLDRQGIIEKHHAAQRMLRSRTVLIPYAKALVRHFPNERPEARRAYSHLLNLICASALLYSRQRVSDSEGRIMAHQDDYKLAKRLLDGPLARVLGLNVSDAAKRMLERISGWAIEGKFNSREAKIRENLSERAVSGHLRELYRAGHLNMIEPSRGPMPCVWQITQKATDGDGRANLPDPLVVFACCPHADKAQDSLITEDKWEDALVAR